MGTGVVMPVIHILNGVIGYGFSMLCYWWIVLLTVSVGVNWMEIWSDCRVAGLGEGE